MRTRPKPTLGQTLYRLNVGNNARQCPQVLTPVVVSKVGRKYFTVRKEGQYALESTHHVDGWYERTEYSANYALYESEQAWEDEEEARILCGRIGEVFHYGHNKANLTLASLRTIMSIIERERE